MDQEASEREEWGLFRMEERLWVMPVEGEEEEEGESKSALDLDEDELVVRVGCFFPNWEDDASISCSFSGNRGHRRSRRKKSSSGGQTLDRGDIRS